jgi:hypothetical protein
VHGCDRFHTRCDVTASRESKRETSTQATKSRHQGFLVSLVVELHTLLILKALYEGWGGREKNR